MDRDEIPDLGEEASFSGTRIQRGLYRTKDGENINADLNGSANILRKAFPDAFSGKCVPDFKNIIVIKHPDEMLKKQKCSPCRKGYGRRESPSSRTAQPFERKPRSDSLNQPR